MPRTAQKALLLLSLCALSAGPQAQTIYRCGSNYSQVPCGGAVEINANDARSAEQKKASENVIAQDGRIAEALEKARIQAEKQRTTPDGQLRQAQVKASKDAEKTSTKPPKPEKKVQPEPFVAKASTPSSK